MFPSHLLRSRLHLISALWFGISVAWGPIASCHAQSVVATAVFGQQDLIHNGINQTKPDSLAFPTAVAIDQQDHLYVADSENNRVLGWLNASSFADGSPADIVIGQPDFRSGQCNAGVLPGDINGIGPDSLCLGGSSATFVVSYFSAGIAVDAAGNLFVADIGNNRVLEFDSPVKSCRILPCAPQPANLVFGQLDFVHGLCNQGNFFDSASSLCGPTGVALDAAGNFFVSDAGNQRVLEFNTPLNPSSGEAGAGDTVADLSFGSPLAGPASCGDICGPVGLAIDTLGNLFVVDSYLDFILEYNTPLNPASGEPGAGDTNPDNFLPSWTSGNPSAASVKWPMGVAVDKVGNLYLADYYNSRVLVYDTPLNPFSGERGAGDGLADLVFGQPNFTTANCPFTVAQPDIAPTADSLCLPFGLTLDTSANLYVADSMNNRVLVYNTPMNPDSGEVGAGDTTADRRLGQADFDHGAINRLDGTGLNNPNEVSIDASGHVYLADSTNSRVLGWLNASSFISGQAADLVLGQPDFTSTGCGSPMTPCFPLGVAADSAGNVYVSDDWNARVLGYKGGFKTCSAFPCVGPAPTLLFGQSSFSNGKCNLGRGLSKASAYSICGAGGVAVDSKGNLYLADGSNHRVLEYDTPFLSRRRKNATAGIPADRVFGQQNFKSSECNRSDPPKHPTAGTLCGPSALAFDSKDHLFVADTGNNRILEYLKPLEGRRAHLVLGQPKFTSWAGCESTPSASDFCVPTSVAADAKGGVYAIDNNRNRVLGFDAPLTNGLAASHVYGQSNFTGAACNSGTLTGDIAGIGPDSLCFTAPGDWLGGLAVDADLNLYVSDADNNRVLIYSTPAALADRPPAASRNPVD